MMTTIMHSIPIILIGIFAFSILLNVALNNFIIYSQILLIYFVLAGSKITLSLAQKSFEIYGLNIYFSDLIILVNLTLLFLSKKPNKKKSFRQNPKTIWFFLILTTSGIVFWSLGNGVKPGWNNWRIYMLSFTLFLVAQRQSFYFNDERIKNVFLLPLFLILVLLYSYVIQFGLGTAEDTNLTTGSSLGRPITASGALIIMFSFFYYLSSSKITVSVSFILTMCLVSIIIVQHRSVWLATLGGVISWVIGSKRNSIASSKIFSLILLGLFTLATYLSVSQLRISSKSTNTLEWRFTRWVDSFKVSRSNLEWILGAVFGPTPVQRQEGPEFKVFAHNAYVATIESFGIVGFLLLIAFLISRFESRSEHIYSVSSNMFLISAFIFGFFYWIEPSYWLILGIYSASSLQLHPEQ
ncbi:MAG: hypothetical protein EBU66_17125 [Bacteroidetes bacterium]|nr:hypothetical protein [Bacteroidota bacterium]